MEDKKNLYSRDAKLFDRTRDILQTRFKDFYSVSYLKKNNIK